MPPDDQHRTKAERNEQFADSLDKTDPIRENWAVVAAFYAALHYVEQFFVKYGTPCFSHDERNNQFKGDKRILNAYKPYSYLSHLSHQARYKLEPLPIEAYNKYAKPRLLAVKQQIDEAMALAGNSAQPPSAVVSSEAKKSKTIVVDDPARPMPGRPIPK